MLPQFTRLIGTSQAGKKMAVSMVAGAMIYTYALECKNDVLFYTTTKSK